MKSTLVTLVTSLMVFSCSAKLQEGNPVTLGDGLSYQTLSINSPDYSVKENFELFFIKFDPQKYRIELLLASDFNSIQLETRDFSKLSKSFLTINGSLFDTQFHPLGLQIQRGKPIKQLRQFGGAVFYLLNGVPKIVRTKDFNYDKGINLAIQSRPRLVDHGNPDTNLKVQIARRSFIGITSDQQIVIGATDKSQAYADDLALVLSMKPESGGVGCEYALNLDGGSSSQLFFSYNNFEKEIIGGMGVPNALAVFKK